MRFSRTVVTVALTTLLALPVLGLAQAKSPAEQQVLQAEKDRFAAMVKADEPALNRLLADDVTYAHSNANFQTKSQFIGDSRSGVIKYISIAPSEPDWQVRVTGSIAIVNGVAAVHVIDHGTDLNIKIRYTDVHRNVGGAWQLVAWQSTRFP